MLSDDGYETPLRQAKLGLASYPIWGRIGDSTRDFLLTLFRGRAERCYEIRSLQRMARGERLDTLGLEVRDEGATRRKSEHWLARLIALGLQPDHLCIEFGCGSLWCAEPIIRHLNRGRFIGLDVTERFYTLGRRRLGSLFGERQVRLDIISQASLRNLAALAPDFVFSHRVLHHVPLRALRSYVQNLSALLSARTVLVIEHMPRPVRGSPVRARRYNSSDLERHLPPNWICREYSFGFVIAHRDRLATDAPLESALSTLQ